MLTDQTTDNPIREYSEEEDLTDELTREDTCVRTLTVPEEMNARTGWMKRKKIYKEI